MKTAKVIGKRLLGLTYDHFLNDCFAKSIKGTPKSSQFCLLANWCKREGASLAEFTPDSVYIAGEGETDVFCPVFVPDWVGRVIEEFDEGKLDEWFKE